MSLKYQKITENTTLVETSLEKLSQNVYYQLLENYPQFKNLSDRTEQEILQATLISSIREVLNNFEEYLESYYLEKLKQTKVETKQEITCLRK